MTVLSRTLYRGFSPYYFARKALFNVRNYRDYLRRRNYSSVVDDRTLAAIKTDGWSTIEMDPAKVRNIAAYCQQVEQRQHPSDEPPAAHAGKDFWTLLVRRENLNEHPDLIAFAKDSLFKNLASAYLGTEAVLSEVTLMKSFPTGKNAKHSQMWHLDADDSQLLLFYVYCRDVDDKSGPFQLIPKRLQGANFLPRFLRKYAHTDADLQADSNAVSVVGPAGTVFACDTATTYHCGSRCESKTRLALSIRYTTRAGLYPVRPLD